MPKLPLPSLVADDPENLLSYEARQRIARAFVEFEKIKNRTLSEIDIRYRAESNLTIGFVEYLGAGQAFIDFTESRVLAARTILRVEAEEYNKLNLSGVQFRQIMQDKIDEMVYSMEFTGLQRSAFESEFLWLDQADATKLGPVSGLLDQRSITSHAGAARVKEYIKCHALTPTGFATSKGEHRIDEKTVRSVIKSGKGSPATWAELAGLMEMEPSELLKD